jgi:transcriptional regulator with XRE-family HTH domain
LYSAGVRAAAQAGNGPDRDLRAWLRELREAAGLTQEELAAAVGTDRRNVHRWEVAGHDPGGTMLLRLLSALGVRIEPPLPGGVPRAVNAELRELDGRFADAADAAATRHDQLVARLDAQDEQLRLLSARLEETTLRRG